MIEIAKRAARLAGEVLVARYQEPHDIRFKGLRDIVTEADLEAEAVVLDTIRAADPAARFMAEESNGVPSEGPQDDVPTWYVDPLDGTTNFAHGLPTWSVSIALARRGRVELGVVYDPLLDHLFYAERGRGAFLNDRPLQVSTRDELLQAVVLLDWPRDQQIRQKSARALERLVPVINAARSTGSAALSLCYIAAGWGDIYFQYTLSPWDVAAGILIVEEAGGRVTNIAGAPPTLHQPDWLVTNGFLHKQVLELAPFE